MDTILALMQLQHSEVLAATAGNARLLNSILALQAPAAVAGLCTYMYIHINMRRVRRYVVM